MLFKNSVRTSKRTPHFTITKINWLTLFNYCTKLWITEWTETLHCTWQTKHGFCVCPCKALVATTRTFLSESGTFDSSGPRNFHT